MALARDVKATKQNKTRRAMSGHYKKDLTWSIPISWVEFVTSVPARMRAWHTFVGKLCCPCVDAGLRLCAHACTLVKVQHVDCATRA